MFTKRTHRQRQWSPVDGEKARILNAIRFSPNIIITPVTNLQEQACEELENAGILLGGVVDGIRCWTKV